MTAPDNIQLPQPRPRPVPDDERIELDYRAGIKTIREIGAEHRLSAAAIIKRAKKFGWTRDLNAKIQAKADALVNKALVNSKANTEKAFTERQVIDAGAAAIMQVRLSHRKDIGRSRSIVMSMLDELELTCGPENAALLSELGEIMREPDDKGQDKRKDLFDKLLSLNGRSVTMKNLAESLKGMVALEREAFSLNAAPAQGDSAGGDTGTAMTDAERAIRLSRLVNSSPAVMAAFEAMRHRPTQ